MTFGALLYLKASFLFLQGYFPRKRPQAPSQITIAQLIVLPAMHGSRAPFRSFDGNSTEIPHPAPSIPPPREPPNKGTQRQNSNYRFRLIATLISIRCHATLLSINGTLLVAHQFVKIGNFISEGAQRMQSRSTPVNQNLFRIIDSAELVVACIAAECSTARY
jgi:hypothetical protein